MYDCTGLFIQDQPGSPDAILPEPPVKNGSTYTSPPVLFPKVDMSPDADTGNVSIGGC